MSKTLEEIAKQLCTPATNKKGETKPVPKVQLIYAFNGTGKTRLSRELKKLVAPKNEGDEGIEPSRNKFLYYSAHTEDLFYWDNDLGGDAQYKLKIQRNSFTDWILREQGDVNIIGNFQRYTNKRLLPKFIENEEVVKNKEGKNVKIKTYPEVTFTVLADTPEGPDESKIKIDDNKLVKRGKDALIKISKGEESNFIWSVFYTLLREVISILNEPDKAKRSDNQFDELQYVFIDDPVSSLDENHLIELAVDLATLIKGSAYTNGSGLRFVITTHNPLFYNILWNDFNNDLYKDQLDGSQKCVYKRDQSKKYRLIKKADGTFELIDSNDHPFSYHLFLLDELREIEDATKVKKFHFNFLRNILEKTSTFLGHRHWNKLLEKLAEPDREVMERMLNLYSHSAHAGEEISDIKDEHKEKLIELVKFLTKTYGFMEERLQNAGTN